VTNANGKRASRSPSWRRKWKRTDAAHRRAAAAALGDLLDRRPARRVLWPLLIVSLLAHVPLAILGLGRGRGTNLDELASEKTYLRKVMQKQRAREVSRKVQHRMTMPPPPPDPEAVVSNTLTGEITTDIDRVIGQMLPQAVRTKLAGKVTTDLRAELDAAAKSIAEGQLSQADIEALQRRFKARAHAKTVQALREHREETQIDQAKMSVAEWYDSRVSRTLRAKLRYELYVRPYGRGTVWGNHWNRIAVWGACRDGHYLNKIRDLGQLAVGRHCHRDIPGRPLEHGWRMLPDWPEPSAAQASAIETVLRGIHERHPKGWAPSWTDALAALLDSYYPHKASAAQAARDRLGRLWDQALALAAAYRQAASKAGGAETEAARKASMTALTELHQAAQGLWVGPQRAGQYRAVNQAVRSRVLRGPQREKVYRQIVEALLKTFAPAIRDLAQNEYREGILIRQAGVDEAGDAFVKEIVGFLRKDIAAAIPKGQFDELVFAGYANPYVSAVTGRSAPPTAEDIARDEQALAATLASWPAAEKAYADRRAEAIERDFAQAGQRVAAELADRFIEDGRFGSRFYASVESVDHTDQVAQRLNARQRAMAGRGQDLAQLTAEGVPDPSASMVALMFGASKGHGASLEPFLTTMAPAHVLTRRMGRAIRPGPARYPPPPASWGRITQPDVKPPFGCHRAEGIPFLANFPRLDGDLTDWGGIRPLVLQNFRHAADPPKGPLMVYAAWNYQGFFFGYRVDRPLERFAYPKPINPRQPAGGLVIPRPRVPYGAFAYGWAYGGDYLRLLFDTLDARRKLRGEPYLQEFVILPRGTVGNPDIPGIERIIESQRYATLMVGQWHGNKASCKIFPPQPSAADGPDGTGPYRVTQASDKGYTTEVFLPRSLFNVPVFCPGWYLGFECIVCVGEQQRRPHGQVWGNPRGGREYGTGIERNDYPNLWGDLLLLGTDPRLAVQDADETGTLTRAIVPGHSYLVTVIDPDRNVHLAAEDIVLVSAEVAGGPSQATNDVEVFCLTETGKNTSIFRGYVDTQPGRGREVQGVIEAMAGQQVRLGYLDLANAKGKRNVVYHLQLPVVSAVARLGGLAGPP